MDKIKTVEELTKTLDERDGMKYKPWPQEAIDEADEWFERTARGLNQR